MERLNRIFVSYWFGEALLLVICAGVVITAALLTPSPEHVSLFGHEIPVMCSFRQATGWPCPGCGLTRSFAFMAHLAPLQALKLNPLGPPFFLFIAAQVPYRAFKLLRGPRNRVRATA